MYRKFIGKKVVIRHQLSGVWMAIVDDADERGRMAITGRRCWRWSEALDASTIAAYGCGGRITALRSLVIGDAPIECIEADDAAYDRVMSAEVAR